MVAKAKSEFSAQLAAIKKQWAGAREDAKSSDFENLPEGKYIAWMTGEMKFSQNGNLGISWRYTVANGDSQGKSQFSWSGLSSPDNLVWLARLLARVGYEVESVEIEEMEEIVADINGAPKLVQIQIKEKDGYTNAYVNKHLDPDDFDDLAPAPGAEASNGKAATAAAATTAATTAAATPKPKAKGKAKASPPPVDDDGPDYADMGRKADAGDKKAEKILTQVCEDENVDPNDFGTWEEVGEELTRPAGDEPTDEDAPAEIKKGSAVFFVLKGKAYTGKVTDIKGDVVKVKTNDGKTLETSLDRCELETTPF